MVGINILSELENNLTSRLLRVVEQTAISAARFRGFGDEVNADEAAVNAMHEALGNIAMNGRIIIGEGVEGECEKLYAGELIGGGDGPLLSIVVDALEGRTQCAKALPGALTTMAVGGEDCFLPVPEVYMDKIAIGAGYPSGTIDLDASPADNLKNMAEAKGCKIEDLTVCVLDRPRHGRMIEEVRDAGAAINLIVDGDIAGVFKTTDPETSGVDMYLGVGGAQEGVLGAAILKCRGGQMQGRLKLLVDVHKERMKASNIENVDIKYDLDDIVRGDVVLAAAGVTSGWMLGGVQSMGDAVATESVIMTSVNKSIRWVTMQTTLES